MPFVANCTISWLKKHFHDWKCTSSKRFFTFKPLISVETVDATIEFSLLKFLGVSLSRKRRVQEYAEEFFFNATLTGHALKQTEHCNIYVFEDSHENFSILIYAFH